MHGRSLPSLFKRRVRSRGCWLRLACCASLALMVYVPAAIAADNARVSIEGGIDPDEPSGHNYVWTVTNHHTSPVLSVEFPHYLADTFLGPPGWKTHCTYLVNIGVAKKPGVCTASLDPQSGGLVRGSSAKFSMRIAPEGAPIGRGAVLVRFADGSQVSIDGVTLPQAPDNFSNYVPLIGIGLIFVVVVIVRERRRGKTAAASED